ncbi:MAG: M15 family metallopeptidase [Xanthomonadaceae bacterium]|nr:M15 family metallopeptidase [Xanthomonadaceae bacterium]
MIDFDPEKRLNEWGVHLYVGGFNYRIMRGSARLSMHSWSCAVDFDSARNRFGDTTPNFASIPQVLEAFDAEGWTWGGRWRRPDGMHWQAADV